MYLYNMNADQLTFNSGSGERQSQGGTVVCTRIQDEDYFISYLYVVQNNYYEGRKFQSQSFHLDRWLSKRFQKVVQRFDYLHTLCR